MNLNLNTLNIQFQVRIIEKDTVNWKNQKQLKKKLTEQKLINTITDVRIVDILCTQENNH